ncbi:PREDICTED: uncharacterized protein LOC103897961 [Aptenodytes forsteri]|uniref:uncharacterized protein LOC103897961 n=1 Tax=Aptenodytes forsteri TaxID=9233 RepID=UPI0004F46121|nr:PREDICTED: uncharacterized protein LOC103897961 [Aptenodytes forsteri]
MGRLDDHAKRRIVELRRAGLSFRKIKKVLELDDIRVTPQAVYLFLKRKTARANGCPYHRNARRGPRGQPGALLPWDTKEGIQIVSVASLCKDGGQLGEALPVGLPPGNGDDGSTCTPSTPGSCPPPGGPATPPQPLPSRGRLVAPPTRNPALVVKKKIVDRAILLQKKVKDASTQTALLNPTSPGNQNPAWGGPVLPPAPSSHVIAEKLDAVQTEIQKLSQALHAVLERQCRLERQQEHQQRLQQEVLMTLQQLSSTVSHGTVPANQPCVPFSSMAEPSPTVPNFSQFKMELI